MSDSTLVRAPSAASRTNGGAGAAQPPAIDWAAAARTPEFRELVHRRKRFVLPATVFFLAWYLGFIALAGYAPEFMGNEFLADGLTVGYMLALSQFVMTWGLAWLYLRKSDREFDPLAERAARRAKQVTSARPAAREPVPSRNGEEVRAR
jgi:uncharacterized membrane protein (DUF485 family)